MIDNIDRTCIEKGGLQNLCIQKNNIFLEIGQALADDHAAVMVGAGFSKNAEKISTAGREFLNWNQLSDLFYEKFVW